LLPTFGADACLCLAQVGSCTTHWAKGTLAAWPFVTALSLLRNGKRALCLRESRVIRNIRLLRVKISISATPAFKKKTYFSPGCFENAGFGESSFSRGACKPDPKKALKIKIVFCNFSNYSALSNRVPQKKNRVKRRAYGIRKLKTGG
jgi:hypothetical protein